MTNHKTDKRMLDVALDACRSVMEERRQGDIAMEALVAGRRPPAGTMSEELLLRTVRLASEALELATIYPPDKESEILQEALAACRCVIAQQAEIDEVLEALENGTDIPAGSTEFVEQRMVSHASRALKLAEGRKDPGPLVPPPGQCKE
jgi:hypothetical protein